MVSESGGGEHIRPNERFVSFIETRLANDSGEHRPHSSRVGSFAPQSEGLPKDAVMLEHFSTEEGEFHRIICGRIDQNGFIQTMYVLVWEDGRFLDGTVVGNCEDAPNGDADCSRLLDWLERLDREGLIIWQDTQPLSD